MSQVTCLSSGRLAFALEVRPRLTLSTEGWCEDAGEAQGGTGSEQQPQDSGPGQNRSRESSPGDWRLQRSRACTGPQLAPATRCAVPG